MDLICLTVIAVISCVMHCLFQLVAYILISINVSYLATVLICCTDKLPASKLNIISEIANLLRYIAYNILYCHCKKGMLLSLRQNVIMDVGRLIINTCLKLNNHLIYLPRHTLSCNSV